MKPCLACLLTLLLLLSATSTPCAAVDTLEGDAITLSAQSAILMERSTGEILYEKNATEHLSPASVTKVMTMLLICEAIDAGTLALTDTVVASDRAASMGGSQVYLRAGEVMTVSDMLKCIAVVSANDCCVAMAEQLAGTEDSFVQRMNERAAQLGMLDTHFTCCSGLLESDAHYSCARDIAIMSRELLSHDLIREYTGIWMDSIRDGAFTLANTNKLIYYYAGATGLKTGFTSKAMYCLSASAMREDTEYIAVVLHAPTSAQRFEDAKTLLSYAFANYTLADPAGMTAIPPVRVTMGQADSLQPVLAGQGRFVISRQHAGDLHYDLDLPESIPAPVDAGQVVGTVYIRSLDETLAELPLYAPVAIEHLHTLDIFQMLLTALYS